MVTKKDRSYCDVGGHRMHGGGVRRGRGRLSTTLAASHAAVTFRTWLMLLIGAVGHDDDGANYWPHLYVCAGCFRWVLCARLPPGFHGFVIASKRRLHV